MATAVETSSQARTPSPPASLALASLIGAAYVLAALATLAYAVPALWATNVSPQLGGNDLLNGALRITAQAITAVLLVLFGRSLAGANPPRGLRGGIFLMISVACVIFFIVQAIGLRLESVTEGATPAAITGAIGLGLLFGAFRLFTSPRGDRWMVSLEEQGWFHASSYKRALGHKVRRLTVLGILIIGGSGVYSLFHQTVLPVNWVIAIPFTHPEGAPDGTHEMFTLIAQARYVIPTILFALTLWIAFRVVNLPTFAEFLIATEAEMNKVSWSTRKRLYQDTIVVLVATIAMALFLLVVDLFWGWLLSREVVGVLPSKSSTGTKANEAQAAKW